VATGKPRSLGRWCKAVLRALRRPRTSPLRPLLVSAGSICTRCWLLHAVARMSSVPAAVGRRPKRQRSSSQRGSRSTRKTAMHGRGAPPTAKRASPT
ncbi:unnamed protein product, partial [Symbiodinium necroappetens]